MKQTYNWSRAGALLMLASCLSLSSVSLATALGTPANPPAGSSFDTRLAQRKAEQNEKLDAKALTHIQQTCVRAQASVRNLQRSSVDMLATRTATYQSLDGIVWYAIGQLKMANLDTFAIEQTQTALATKITAFQTTATNYQQTLNDVLTVNCQSDPTGYQALLDTARVYYKQLATQSSDIRTHTANTVQPAMQTFIDQLQTKAANNGVSQ